MSERWKACECDVDLNDGAREWAVLVDRTSGGPIDVEFIAANLPKERALQIVNAVNSHDDLLAACEEALGVLQDPESQSIGLRFETFSSDRTSEARQVIRAAIAKAKTST